MATGTTRFDKFLPRDYSMEWFVPKLAMPNFEAWDRTLKTQQAQYDTGVALSEKMPKYLPTEYDEALRAEYKNMASTLVDDISKAYQEQGITAGNRLLRDRGRQLVKEWQPGGRAAALEDRYTSYQAALKEIEDAYAKDPRGVNKDFAKWQLGEQLKKDIGYDPETGKYGRISTPDLHTDPNIQKLILDSVTKIDKDGYTDILKKDAYWFEKVRKLERPEDKIEMVTQAILEQYPNQVQIEAWNKKRHLPEEKAKEVYDARLDQQYKSKEKLVTDAKNMDKNKLKQIQSELVEQGYDVTISGKYDPATEKALKSYLDKTKETIESKKGEFNYDTFAANEITSEYMNYAKGFATQDIDRDLIYNPVPMAQAKLANARAQTEALLGLTESLKPKPASNSLVLPDVAINSKEFLDQLGKSKETTKAVEKSIQETINQPNSPFNGWAVQNVAEAYRVYEEMVKKNPNMTVEQQRAAYGQALQANSSYKFSPQQVDGIFNSIAGQGESSPVKQMMDQLGEAQNLENLMAENVEAIASTYLNTKEGKANLKSIEGYRLPGETDAELVKRAISTEQNTGFQLARSGETGEVANRGTLGLVSFKNNMISQIEAQQKNGNTQYAGALNNYSINVGKDDDYLTPTIDIINDVINTGDYFNFSSDGMAGLTFKDTDGKKFNTSAELAGIKVTDGKIFVGPDGKTKYVAKGHTTFGDGKTKRPVSAVIDLNPGNPFTETVRKGLIGILATQEEQGNKLGADGVIQNLMALDGHIGAGSASKQMVGKTLTTNNTKPADQIYLPTAGNKATPLSNYGYRTKEISEINFVDNTGGERNYKVQGILTDDGNTLYAVTTDRNGSDVVLTGEGGNIYYKDPLAAERSIYKKQYMLEVPVVRETTNIKNARVLNAEQQSALINANSIISSEEDDDE